MKIGVPKEIISQEYRVSINPESAKLLLESSHQLFIQKNGKKLPATAKDYSNVRWVLTSSLKAGEKGSVQYVVQVK